MTTWQPGDPLWIDHAGTQCTRPMFQLVGDQGGWDGASWPMPASIWALSAGVKATRSASRRRTR